MDPTAAGKSYWRFRKQDFYPESTFQNASTYLAALSNTPTASRTASSATPPTQLSFSTARRNQRTR
ncbi:hypothetical protein ACS0TY_025758 [Phlomoides rotata]